MRTRAIMREAQRLSILAKMDMETVEAMETVCNELEAIRERQKAERRKRNAD